MLDTIWISALGALVGAVLVLTGAGGGAIAVPLLLFGAGLSMQQASPVALVAVGLVAAIGAAIGLRDGLVRYRAAALIGGAGMAGAPVGVMFARHLPQAPLMLAFAAFMLMTAWRMARPQAAGTAATPAQVCLRPDGAKRLQWTRACAAALGRTGAVAGVLSGLLGVGGGFVIVPALERRSNLDLRSIQATSLAVIALVAVSGIVAAVWQGQVQADVAMPFAGGAVAGLLAGRALSGRLKPQHLRRGFAALTLCVAALLIWRATGAWA
jgi:uncharacterized membrane protein YfcA